MFGTDTRPPAQRADLIAKQIGDVFEQRDDFGARTVIAHPIEMRADDRSFHSPEFEPLRSVSDWDNVRQNFCHDIYLEITGRREQPRAVNSA